MRYGNLGPWKLSASHDPFVAPTYGDQPIEAAYVPEWKKTVEKVTGDVAAVKQKQEDPTSAPSLQSQMLKGQTVGNITYDENGVPRIDAKPWWNEMSAEGGNFAGPYGEVYPTAAAATTAWNAYDEGKKKGQSDMGIKETIAKYIKEGGMLGGLMKAGKGLFSSITEGDWGNPYSKGPVLRKQDLATLQQASGDNYSGGIQDSSVTVGYDQFGRGYDQFGNPTNAFKDMASWKAALASPGHGSKDAMYADDGDSTSGHTSYSVGTDSGAGYSGGGLFDNDLTGDEDE